MSHRSYCRKKRDQEARRLKKAKEISEGVQKYEMFVYYVSASGEVDLEARYLTKKISKKDAAELFRETIADIRRRKLSKSASIAFSIKAGKDILSLEKMLGNK